MVEQPCLSRRICGPVFGQTEYQAAVPIMTEQNHCGNDQPVHEFMRPANERTEYDPKDLSRLDL